MRIRFAVAAALVSVLSIAACGVTTSSNTPGSSTPGSDTTGSGAAAVAGAKRPNIVLVMLDDARVDDMPYMPNVQRLIKRPGAVFSRAFLSYPLCCPVRASVLTGKYAHNHGVRHVHYPAGSYQKWVESGTHRSTLPVWLRRSGYHTVMIGKYLNGYRDYVKARYGVRNAPKDPGWSSWKATLETYNYRKLAIRHRPGGYVSYEGRYGTHVLNDIAVNVTRTQAANPKPFFMWLSYVAPHVGTPHEPGDPKLATPHVAKRDRDTFRHLGNVKSPAFNERDVSDKPSHIRNLPRIGPKLAAQIRETRQQRVESLQAVDRGIGRLVTTLRRTGQLKNTVIIFTSDNGYSLGEHRRPSGKILPYRESLNTPLYIRGPGIPANRHVTQRVSMSIDIAPTVLDLANVSAPHQMDGVSLYDVIRDPGPRSRPLLVEAWHANGRPQYTGLRGWRYLYVEHATGEVELYDLVRDPHQLRSRHDDPEYLAARTQLAAKLAATRKCDGPTCRG
ncbi:MAG: sulfatase-like hydrolase/transferase [Actinophytocola sp.]|nr:sulfatase-like hydrolase/transferase [Actinophytocola sp.]